jgi:hypothetical protein
MSVSICDKKINVSFLKVVGNYFNDLAEKTAFFRLTKNTYSTGKHCTLPSF